jgi:hypothetical protein
MTNRERAKAWLKANIGGRSDWAHDRDVAALTRLLDEVTEQAKQDGREEQRRAQQALEDALAWP